MDDIGWACIHVPLKAPKLLGEEGGLDEGDRRSLHIQEQILVSR